MRYDCANTFVIFPGGDPLGWHRRKCSTKKEMFLEMLSYSTMHDAAASTTEWVSPTNSANNPPSVYDYDYVLVNAIGTKTNEAQ